MPSKRRPVDRPLLARITPEAVEAFRRADAIRAAGLDDVPEPAGCRAEFIALLRGLRRALGLQPWDGNPVCVPSEGDPPAWANAERYKAAQARRRALEGR